MLGEKGRPDAADEPIPPDDAEQGLEKDLPRAPLIEDDGVTVASEATDDPPDKASDRLDRMLLLRAQMVQLEGRLEQLESPESDQEIKQIEKALRKYRRQAERRYAAGEFMYLPHRLFVFNALSQGFLLPNTWITSTRTIRFRWMELTPKPRSGK